MVVVITNPGPGRGAVPVGETPQGLAINPNGTFAYVVNTEDLGNGDVSVISTASNTVVATIAVGLTPLFIAFPTRTQDPIAALIAQVESLIAAGTLTQNQGDGLIDKLEEAIAKRDQDQTGVACNQPSSFINQVNAFINNHSLSQAQGQSLINQTNAIRANLGCP